MPSNTERRMRKAYYDDIEAQGAAGSALTQGFLSGIGDFDADAAFKRRVMAAGDMTREGYAEDLEDLQGSHAAMGRIRTGFAGRDEERLLRDRDRDLQRIIAESALRTTGMDLDRLNLMVSYGDRMSDRALSARGGEYHTERAQRLSDAADRRSGWGNIITAGLGAAGTVFGGPAGGALASGIGSALFGKKKPKETGDASALPMRMPYA